MRKLLFLTISILVIFLVVFLFGFFNAEQRQKTANLPPATPRPTLESSPTPIPSAPEIEISGTKVSNFYKTAARIGKSGDIYIKNNNPKKYRIMYQQPFNQFMISILASPFTEIRLEAEQDFLSQLNITKQEACSLNVIIVTQSFVNPDYSDKSYKLSFCE